VALRLIRSNHNSKIAEKPHAAGYGQENSPPSVRHGSRGRAVPTRQEGAAGMQPSEVTDVLNRPISQELLARDLTRLAYVAKDGTPRSIPIGFTWNGSAIVMCTPTNAAKVKALRHNPAVALTIDTEVHPPRILLIRGQAELDVVDGIPDEFLQTNGTYTMTPEQRVEWEAEVRSLYESMVRIVVVPTWAKLIDFETTLPSAVEELVRERDERQRA
jgi:pyridoxamine 5'-phosphate oxidase-like protein